MSTPVRSADVDAIGGALAARIRAVAAAVRRLDGLAPGGGDANASAPSRDDAREIVLRLFRLAGDLDNHRILRAVAEGTGSALGLAVHTGRPRLALWEAVGDLVQVGLLERDPAHDGISLTTAGGAMLALIDQLVDAGEPQ